MQLIYKIYNKLKFCLLLCVADNGLNPVWNETCEFDIQNPDMALIRFQVQDEDMFGDPNFLGQAVYPVSSVRKGLVIAVFNH